MIGIDRYHHETELGKGILYAATIFNVVLLIFLTSLTSEGGDWISTTSRHRSLQNELALEVGHFDSFGAAQDHIQYLPIVMSRYMSLNAEIVFVSFRDGNSEIYLTDALGTGVVNITQHPASDWYPDWSPDGSKIAFSSNRAGTMDIYVMNFDGSGVRQLTALPTNSLVPVWSPDGSKIAFSSQRSNLQGLEIYWMYADGSGLRRVYNGPGYGGRISWSPDGNQLLFDAYVSDFDLFIVYLDGSGFHRVASTAYWEYDPAWSPEGSKIAFGSNRLVGYVDVYVANANGSGVKNLSLHQSYSYGPVWSPDSQWIVFMSVEGLYVTRPTWTNPTKVTDLSILSNLTEWTWSPDSERIVFAANSGGSNEIFVIGIDGQGLRNLSNHSARDSDPVWRP